MAVTVDGRDGYAQAGPLGAAAESLRARAFRQARRHSLLVRVLRLALPIGSLAIVAIYAFTLSVGWRIGPGRLNVGEVQLTADDLTMKNPSYFGLTKEGGRYEVRAKKAVVEFNKDAPIKLIDVDGDLMQANGVVTNLKAKHGLLDNAKSELELFDGIDIEASNGLKARLSRAKVFNKEHRIVSNHPVEVDMPTGRVRGATMTMRTDTKETTFVGNVAVHLKASTPAGGTTPVTPAFGRDSRQPVDVTSEQLYVNDAAKTALFMGGVVAVQGDSTLKTPELHVAYEGKAASELANADAQQPQEASRLSRLVAKNGAVVTIGADRRVTSDEAEFDAKADTALFTGNVVVNQQKNVLQGSRLFVDRKTGKSRLETPAEAGQPAGRIAATFYQNDGKAGPQSKPKSQAGEAAAAVQGSVFGTFKTDPNAPIDIEADTLDVHDQAKQAIFRGKVKSQQGDFIVRTIEMTVYYTGQSGFGLTSGGGDVAGKEFLLAAHARGGAAKGADRLQGRPDRHRRLGQLRRQGQHGPDGRPRRGVARQGRRRGAEAQDRSHDGHVPVRAGVRAATGRARPRKQGLAALHGSRSRAVDIESQRSRVSARQAVPAVLSEGRERQGQGRHQKGLARRSRRQQGR